MRNLAMINIFSAFKLNKIFESEEDIVEEVGDSFYRVVIVDGDLEIEDIIRERLKGFSFQGKGIEVLFL